MEQRHHSVTFQRILQSGDSMRLWSNTKVTYRRKRGLCSNIDNGVWRRIRLHEARNLEEAKCLP